MSKNIQRAALLRGKYTHGHKALNISMIRGFRQLGIPYLWNRINKNTKYVILLWSTEKELKKINKIKQKKPDIKIVAVPTGCRYDPAIFVKSDFTDYFLAASDWHKKSIEETIDKKYWRKIITWPSGVQVDKQKPDTAIHNSVLCYYKLVKENPKITEYLKKQGILTHVLEYGAYQLEDYIALLPTVDFVIFIQDITESQGLAIAEAWAKNKPTIIKHNVNKYGGKTCPYLTKETGLYYNSEHDLFEIIDAYKNNPQNFLDAFTPYEIAKQKYSDEATVKHLVQILQK